MTFWLLIRIILRDGGNWFTPDIQSTDSRTSLNQWPPQAGSIAVVGKQQANKDIIHLINFSNANHLDWRDTDGTQAYPVNISECTFSLPNTKSVRKVWFASPDYNGGCSTELSVTEIMGRQQFSIPYLEYWSMIVVEYE